MRFIAKRFFCFLMWSLGSIEYCNVELETNKSKMCTCTVRNNNVWTLPRGLHLDLFNFKRRQNIR